MNARVKTTGQQKAFAALCAFLFGFVALFGLTLSMQTDDYGMMSDCPFMSEHTVACSMDIVDHIAQWQSLLSAIVSPYSTLAMFAALALIIAAIIVATRAPTLWAGSSLSPPHHQTPESKMFSGLVRAFARGILHPRLYA